MFSEPVMRILKERYLQPGETPKDMFRRVADFVGFDENEKKEFYDVMVNLKFLPNSPALMNAGSKVNMLSACVAGETLVMTEVGHKPIKDIIKGEKVLTHTGYFKKVTDTMKRKVSDYYVLDIECTPQLKITGEHPVLVIPKEQIQCKRSQRLKCLKGNKYKRCRAERNQWREDCRPEDLKPIWKMVRDLQPGDYVVAGYIKENRIQIEPERAWIDGLWLADGSLDGSNYKKTGISFTVGDESKAKLICDIFEKAYGLKGKVHSVTGALVVKFFNVDLANLFWSKGKHNVWYDYIFGSKEAKEAFLKGVLFGDGHNDCIVQQKNRRVLMDLKLLIHSIGKGASFSHSRRKIKAFGRIYDAESSRLTITEGQTILQRDDIMAFRVKSIKHVKAPLEVYNLHVEEDESYVAEGIVVHNCYVLPIEDSMIGIMESLTNSVMINKMGGGVGINFSPLRPKGSLVHSTGGTSSGPVSFMKMFDTAIDVVKQGSRRRGAMIGVMDYNHPDVEEFIRCKEHEGSFTNFNISVGLEREVFKKDSIVLKFGNQEYGEKDTLELLTEISYYAWKTGDPGVLFFDNMNKNNPTDQKLVCTNPCLPGWMLIPTKEGLKRMDEIQVGDEIWVGPNRFETVVKTYDLGVQTLYKITTERGYEFYATPDHQVCTKDGLKRVSELTIGDELEFQTEGYLPDGGNRDLGFLAGVWIGDGYVSNDSAGLSFNPRDIEVAEKCLEMIREHFELDLEIKSYKQRSGNHVLRIVSRDRSLIDWAHKAKDIDWIRTQPKEFLRGFIEGLFFADGHIERGNQMAIALSQTNKRIVDVVRTILLQFGVFSNLYEVERVGHSSDDFYGFNGRMKYWRLMISGEDKFKFVEEFKLYGVLSKHFRCKQKKKSHLGRRYQRIVSIEEYPESEVFDFTTDGAKLFYADGIRSLDCGEISLHPYECCVLGSINLTKCLNANDFDWAELEHLVNVGVKFLDNIIDVQQYPLPQNEEAQKKSRRIGLGVMGWADVLAALGVDYDTQEALKLAEKLMKFIHEKSVKKSIELGKELGYCAYIKQRNLTVNAIAPTGTISMIAGCSSSIEPHFAKSYKKVVLGGEVEYSYDAGNVKTALEIDPEWHVRMQAAFQKYVDNNVSKTINMPKDIAPERVFEMIELAHSLGCKGLTVYRDGSKRAQVLRRPTERPRVLTGETFREQTDCGSMYVTANKTDDQLFEVFINAGFADNCKACFLNALARVLSIAIRAGVDPIKLSDTLNIKCSKDGQSCPSTLGSVLKKVIPPDTRECRSGKCEL